MSEKIVRSLAERELLEDILSLLVDMVKPQLATGVHTDGTRVTQADYAILNRGRAVRDSRKHLSTIVRSSK